MKSALFHQAIIIVLLSVLSLSFCAGQKTVLVLEDTTSSHHVSYLDDLLEQIHTTIGKGRTSKFTFNLAYPTYVFVNKERKRTPFLVFPGDSLVFRKKVDSTAYECVNKPDSLFGVLTALETQVGLEIATHSGYKVQNVLKSEYKILIGSIFNKMKRQLAVFEKCRNSSDTLLYKKIEQEIKCFTLVELLQPFAFGNTQWRYFPTWYADSLKRFKEEIFGTDTTLAGVEYKRALFAYNQFLCRDSLGSKNDFQIQFNSAVRNFKGDQLYFLMAYILRINKPFNPANFYDNVGTFYRLCKNEFFLKYVKDKLDDTDFVFPDFVLKKKLVRDDKTQTTWAELLDSNKGKLIFIDLWASWCAPCLIESKYIKEYIKYYKGKPIVFVSLSMDKKKKVWIKTSKRFEISAEGGEYYWLGEDAKFINFLLTRREKEKTPIWIPRFMIIDEKGRFITSNAIQVHNPESKWQIDLFLKDIK